MKPAKPRSYGAEDLRKRYPLHALGSVGISSLLVVTAFAYPTFKHLFEKDPEQDKLNVEASRVINYSQLSAPPPISLERPEPKTFESAPKIKTVKFLQPVAKKDEEVPEEVEIPTMDEMEHTQIGTVDQEGVDSIVVDVDFVVELPPEPEPEPEEVFAMVESMPEFVGGEEAFMNYLRMNLDYPTIALEARIQGIVFLQFVVEKDGSITDIKVLRGVVSSLDEEAVRVVRQMPKWIPGEQNGRKVRVKYSLPVRFRLRDH